MYPTRLEARGITDVYNASQELAKHEKIGGVTRVPVIFQPIRSICSFYVIIPKGFVALINRHGKYIGQYKAGVYMCPPWCSISHLIPTQYIVYDTPVKECPTQDNVMVTIDVTLVLRIMCEKEESVYNFCYQLGPRGLDEMLKAFQEEAIRGMARKRKYNEIYDLMDSKTDKIFDQTLRDLNNHFAKYGVEITSIAVTNVHLPSEFQKSLQEATVWHNRNEFKTLEQEYELRKIETREIEAKSKQASKEAIEKFQAQKDKEVAESNKKYQLVAAETSKVLAVIRETEKAEVLEIETSGKLAVAEINAKKDISLSKIRSQGQAESEKIRIEAETYVLHKKAESEAIVAESKAQSLDIKAKAEKYASQYLQSKRKYEEKMRSLQTLKALSNNPNVALSGNSKDNHVAQLLANQRNGALLGINANN
jgi:regulator of protease activity HflC (stomatin/prohibitin superfamily)